MKVLAVTGYKPFEIGIFKHDDPALFYIKKAIESRILALLDEGLEWILISGQTLVRKSGQREVAFSLQEEYPELKVAVITPFFDQEKNWNEKNKELYEAVLAQSDYTESLTHRPYESPAQFKQKNRFFIEKADGLLILYDEEVDGSPVYMLNEAKNAQEKRDFPIYTITMDDLRSTVEDYTFYEE